MDMSACARCGENVSPDWIVCPVCTQPTKPAADGLSCLQCNGSIHVDHLQCPHCHVPIIRRYCAGCEHLIPDHAELCPLCGAGRLQKRSFRRILRLVVPFAAAGFALAGLVLYLPGRSIPKAPERVQQSSTLPVPFKDFVNTPEPSVAQNPPPQVVQPVLPFAPDDLTPATNTVALVSIPQVPINPVELLQRGARLKAGRKLSELGNLYIRKRRFKEAAIVLRQAVDAFPPQTRDVSYGESLYHLGYSLRMSGKPAEAIPVLKLALNFPLYSSKVEKELKTASAEMKKSR